MNLAEFFDSPPKEIADSLIKLMSAYHVDEEGLFYKWDAYAATNKFELTEETLQKFKLHLLHQPKARVLTKETLKPNQMDLLSSPALGVSAQSPKRKHIAPSADQISPVILKQVNRAITNFANRTNSNKTEVVYNSHIQPIDAILSDRNKTSVTLLQGQQTKGYRYLYEKLAEKGDLLNNRIESFTKLFTMKSEEGDYIEQDIKEDDNEGFSHPAKPSQYVKRYIGRISCDTFVAGLRLNLTSLILESSRDCGGGSRVKLDFSAVLAAEEEMFLYPGKIICIEATNPDGNLLLVEKIVDIPELSHVTTSGEDYFRMYPENKSTSITVMSAAGPYTLTDSLDYRPFNALLEAVERDRPNVLILIGPFVDIDHPLLKPEALTEQEMSFEEIFKLRISAPLQNLTMKLGQSVEIILIPSQKDAVLDWLAYPQPPIGSAIIPAQQVDTLRRLGLMDSSGDIFAKLFPNPVQFRINELLFAVSAIDTLKDLIQLGLVVKKPNAPLDRFTPSFKAIIDQRHFYPIFPSTLACNLDTSRALASEETGPCVLQAIPDILIIPSILQHTVKNADGCVCINPGMIGKGKSGGTYARMVVHPLLRDGLESDDYFESGIEKRIRVEIVRL